MKKNLLFVLPFLPYPLVSGGHQAIYNGIMAVKDDFNIFIAYYQQAAEKQEEVEALQHNIPNAILLPMRQSVQSVPLHIRLLRKLKNIISNIERKNLHTDKYSLYRLWGWASSPQSPQWCHFIRHVCINNKIDIVQIEMPWLMSFLLCIPNEVKKVFVHHELAFIRHQMEMKDEADDPYVKACYFQSKALERDMLNEADVVITLSPIDKKKLEDLGVTVPVYSSFAVVDTQIRFKPFVSDDMTLSFVGPDSSLPNVNGIFWFLDNCWSLLKSKFPSYSLKIIGKWSDNNKNLILSKYDGIEFLGFVDDLYETMKGTVMIVPITIGSGIRMKILEAAIMGIPFVSTTVGAEGIPVKDSHDCFLTDVPNTFVESIIKLQNKDLKLQFIQNANRMARENYSLEALRKNRLEIYESLI